ncbi:MAG: glycosyltransferase [Candidatus Aminicenantes bacterium]|nr:glycosyltransferase [Candidatus Aminicenantes bacterium]
MKPKISVIIPAYNEEKYLWTALDSVKNQTYDPHFLELIVIDNASTDRTAKVFYDFIGTNELKFKSFLTEEKILGVSRAKNRGALLATGDVLIFLDADSEMSSNLAEVVAQSYLRGYRMGIIRLVPKSQEWLPRYFFRLIEFGKRTFRIAAQMGYCERTLFLEEGGFNPALKLSEDLELFTRIKKRLWRENQDFIYIREAFIRTSTRRMDSFPCGSGYFLIFFQWFLSFLGLGRERYRPYR